MAYSKKAQSTYDKKIVQFKTKYSLSELQDGERVKAYLEQTGQSANSYIKSLIKADLDSKGFSVDNTTIDTMDIDSNADTDITDMS